MVPELSIIMPAYMKGKCIYNTLREDTKILRNLGLKYEIIVIDDGSPDNTYREARRAARKMGRIRVVRYKNNCGKGNAIKYGFRYARGRTVAFIDADLDLSIAQLPVFLDYMKRYKADAVIGSKRHPETKIDYPISRVLLSRGYSFLIKMLFGLSVTDTQTGFKIFKKKVLDSTFHKVVVKRYAFDPELLINIHKQGYKIVEAPIVLSYQPMFGSICLRDVWRMAQDTAGVFYRMYFLRYYDSD